MLQKGALDIAVLGWVQTDSGSVASANALLIRELLRRGHRVNLLAAEGYLPRPEYKSPDFSFTSVPLTEPPALSQLDALSGGRLRRIRGWRWTSQMRRRVAEYLDGVEARRHDVLLCLGTPPPRETKIPTVCWPQGLPGGEVQVFRQRRKLIQKISGRRSYWMLRAAYEARDLMSWGWLRRTFLVVASSRQAEHLAQWGVPREQIAVIPYAVDVDRFRPIGVRRGPENDKQVLCLGRLDPRKRVDLLVDATRILAARRSDFHVRIVGRPGYAPGWHQLVTDAQATLPITYSPAVSRTEAARLLAESHVLVQPSENEEFGHSVAEALASGTPVIVGPSNHTVEYIRAGTGHVFGRYVPAAIAEVLDKALDLDASAAVESCRAAAQAAFAVEVIADRLESAIRTWIDRCGDDRTSQGSSTRSSEI